MVTISEDIVDAFKQQDRPLEVRDAAGDVYYVLTEPQFRRYVYDDSDLTDAEMIAAAVSGLEDAVTAANDQEPAGQPS
jgi:hypothetical protein